MTVHTEAFAVEPLNPKDQKNVISRRTGRTGIEHATQPEFVIRWSRKRGSVAFWDNRCTQHYAVNDYLPHRRVMLRATILGDRPYFGSRAKTATL